MSFRRIQPLAFSLAALLCCALNVACVAQESVAPAPTVAAPQNSASIQSVQTPSTAASSKPAANLSQPGKSSVAALLSPILGPPIPAHGWIFDGDVDYRYRQASTGRSNELYLNEAELDIGHPIYDQSRYQGNVFSQLIYENVPDALGGKGSINDVALGETYINYHLPVQTETGSTAYLQIGQFALPVGLLPVYDTHLYILQTLAPVGIGERIDWGAEVNGRFNGILDYRFAATTGRGPDRFDSDIARVASFRLGRLFATPYGIVNVGGSLLSGLLPVTEVDPKTGFPPILPPSGRTQTTFGYVTKTRIVGDATWRLRRVTARGEAMAGSDESTEVGGYFVMGEYRFAPGLIAEVSRTYWDFGRGNSQFGDNAIGLEADYTSNLVIRFLYEEQRDVPYQVPQSEIPVSPTHLRNIFTVQAVVRF